MMNYSTPHSTSSLPRKPNEPTDYDNVDKSQQQHKNFGGAKPKPEYSQPSHRGMEGQIIMSSKPEHHHSINQDCQETQCRSQSSSHCSPKHPKSLSNNDSLKGHSFEISTEEWPELSHVNLSHHDNLIHYSNISKPDEDIIGNTNIDGDDCINSNDLVDSRHHLNDGQQQCNLKNSSTSSVAIDNHDTSSDYQRTTIRTSNNSKPLTRREFEDSKTNVKNRRSNNNDSIMCEDLQFDNTRHRQNRSASMPNIMVSNYINTITNDKKFHNNNDDSILYEDLQFDNTRRRQNRRASMPNIMGINSHKNSCHHGEFNNSMNSNTSIMADYIALKLTMAELQSELQVAQGKLQDRNNMLQKRNMELEEENCCFRTLFQKLDRLGKLEGEDTDYLWKDKVGGRLLETTIHNDHRGLGKLRRKESKNESWNWKKPELDWGSLDDSDRTPSFEKIRNAKESASAATNFVDILVQDLSLNDDTPSPSHNAALERASSCRSFFERKKSPTKSAITSEDQRQQQSQQSTSLVEKIRNIPRRLSISRLLPDQQRQPRQQYPEAEVDGKVSQYVQFPDVDVHNFRYSDLSYESSSWGRNNPSRKSAPSDVESMTDDLVEIL